MRLTLRPIICTLLFGCDYEYEYIGNSEVVTPLFHIGSATISGWPYYTKRTEVIGTCTRCGRVEKRTP